MLRYPSSSSFFYVDFSSFWEISFHISPNRIVSLNFRGSLYNLLQMPAARVILEERRRLNMAYDVVCLCGVKLAFYFSYFYAGAGH